VANYSGVALSRATRTPLVLEYNGSEVWTAKHWGTPLRYHDLAAAAEEVSLRHAHVVVTVSKVLREELVERGVASERIAYYPNCVDPDLFDSGRFGPGERLTRRRELGIRDDAVVVTFVGTFGRWHGVDVLARAIQRLIVGDPDWLAFNKVQFLLIGDGLLGNEVNATLSSAARAPEFVIRTGIVPQQRTPELLMISDVVLSPHVPNPDGSRFFGSPTKLFEYMAAGKAIVASDLEQIGEVLHPSLDAGRLPEGGPGARATELAVLVQPADVEQLICALRFLVGHPEWRRRLGANARSRAVERYTWKDHVATILSRVHAVIPE
jgi:glycosyltransferase involved in cell wall biosynthesis